MRVLFSIFLLFWGAYTLCITKTMAQLCLNFVFRLFRGGKKSMCMWPFVVSSLPKEAVHAALTTRGGGGGAGAPLPAPRPGAAENLSTSLFVKECFACVSFTLVLEFLPKRQVFCSFHTSLCIHQSDRSPGLHSRAAAVWLSCLPREKWRFTCRSFQYLTYSRGAGGGGGGEL